MSHDCSRGTKPETRNKDEASLEMCVLAILQHRGTTKIRIALIRFMHL